MFKYWRILILLVIVFGSVISIGLKAYPYGREGVVIVYISRDSPAYGILENGMLITKVGDEKIGDTKDWNRITKNLTGNITIIANRVPYEISFNGSTGISVMELDKTNLEFGLDLKGGTRIILKPVENATREMVEQVKSILETRANTYGLKEMRFYTVSGPGEYYIQIDATGIGSDIVNDLLSRQGKFEAKISKPVEIEGNKSFMQIGSNTYEIQLLENDSILLEGERYELNDTFELQGIKFQYTNRTKENLIFLATVYEGEDIELVYSDPQRSGIAPAGRNAYTFFFGVLVSQKGAQRFADVTTAIPSYIDFQTGEEYLDSKIYLYLDGELVSELRIAADLGGKVYTTPQITGTRATREEAIKEKLNLQIILRSGALPVKLETVSFGVISPTLGSGFFAAAVQAGLVAAGVVAIIVFVRYRRIKIAIPMVFIALSEVVIILGIAATGDFFIWAGVLIVNTFIVVMSWTKKYEVDIYAWVGAILIPIIGMLSWTIDLPAIGGIIAAMGTGIDHQIIIADEAVTGKKREEEILTLRESIKRAFFIIFGAAATTIAAMIPLMSIGVGLVRGFAITTMIGVLVGVLITRPAYARIVEALIKK